MELKSYFRGLSQEAREQFCARCGSTYKYLRLVSYGAKTPGESLAIAIERESAGAVTCEELRPDVDWAYLRGTAKREAA